MKKRLITILTIAAMTTMLFTGCGSKKSSDEGTKAAEGNDKKVITIATVGDSLPYSLLDEKEEWTGIDADIWTEICKNTGWEIKMDRASGFDTIFGELDTKRADLAANCFAVKEERTDKYYASTPYYGDAQCIATLPDSDIKTFDDLKGKRVGVTTGQAAETILTDMAKEKGFELVTYEGTNMALQDLSLKRIDACGGAVTTVNEYCKGTGNEIKILDEKLKANNVAYFFPKTEEGKALCDEVSEQVQILIDNGTMAKITEKWLYADMTKLISSENN